MVPRGVHLFVKGSREKDISSVTKFHSVDDARSH